jgi:hypothetical protein
VVVVVVEPVSLLLVQADVCVCVVVVVNGVLFALSFGAVWVVLVEHVFVLFPRAAVGVSARAPAMITAPIIRRDRSMFPFLSFVSDASGRARG